MKTKNSEPKVFLIIIRLGNENCNRKHIVEMAPRFKNVMEKSAQEKAYKLAFSDSDGYGFGYFIKTELTARALRNQLFNSDAMNDGNVLRNGDSFIALEIGEEFDGMGFSAAWTWLQHNYR